MDALIAPQREELLEACEAHLAHAGSNFFPFIWRAFKSHRATVFGLLDALPLRTTSQDTSVEEALRFPRHTLAERESGCSPRAPSVLDPIRPRRSRCWI